VGCLCICHIAIEISQTMNGGATCSALGKSLMRYIEFFWVIGFLKKFDWMTKLAFEKKKWVG
jgi:hypothetical protein